MLEHVGRHLGHAAELARQRPFGAGAVAQDAAEHLGAGRGAGDLLDLGLAVDREEADAELEGARDVTLLLDRVAERDAVGRSAGRERHLDLGDRGGVEARAERGEQRAAPPAPGSPSRRRTRGCRAAPARTRGSCRARRRGRATMHGPSSRSGSEGIRGCVQSWHDLPQGRARTPRDSRVRNWLSPGRRSHDAARWRRQRRVRSPDEAALDWIGRAPFRTPGKKDKPLR